MSPPVRVDIKISLSYSSLSSSQTSQPIIPQIWPELWAAGLMYAEQNEDRAKEKIYKQGHDVKCLVLCLSYVFFSFIFHIHIQYKYWNTLKRETHFLRFISKNNTHRKIYIHLHRKQKVIWGTSLWSVETFWITKPAIKKKIFTYKCSITLLPQKKRKNIVWLQNDIE